MEKGFGLHGKIVSVIMLSLLVISVLALAFNIQPVKASGTIYIRADGSVDPSTAPVSSVDNVTYTFTSNIYDSIVVQRDNIVINGAGYTAQGTGSGKGIDLMWRSNVTVENMTITTFYDGGIGLDYSSSGNNICGNNITNNHQYGIALGGYSSHNVISGNNITGSTYGIELYEDSDNIISGSNITNNTPQGILLVNSANYNSIVESNITNNTCGIGFYSSSNNEFHHNNFIDNTQQVCFYYSGYSNFWDDGYPSGGNYWSDYNGTDFNSGTYQNETGSDGIGDTPYLIDANNRDNYPFMQPWVPYENGTIYIHADGNVDPSGSPVQRKGDIYTLTGNITSDADGIVIERVNMTLDGAGFTIQGTGVIKAGIQLYGRYGYPGLIYNVTIKNVEIKAFEYGIVLYFSNNSTITESKVTGNNRVDIWLQNSHNNTIVGNTITNGYDGIWLTFSDNNTIAGNKLTNNYNGVTIMGYSNLNPSYNNVIVGNSITDNFFGIFLQDSNNNTIAENNISNNSHGIAFARSSSNIITNNNITANLRTFDLYGSDNRIYHNNFINNIQGVVALYESANFWDNGYPSGGNFWSDYSGADLYSGPYQNETGSDGIGDIKYAIDVNNADNYPLVKPYPWDLHDIGVTHIGRVWELCIIIPLKSIVGLGCMLNINVFVMNYGSCPEAFNATVYANTTVIGTIANVALASRNSIILNFTWDTAGHAYGNYTISAYAWPVLGETNTADNDLTGGTVYVGIPGDINGDGTVDIYDAILLSGAFGSSPGSPRWNPNADINGDSTVDIYDAIILSGHFNQHYP